MPVACLAGKRFSKEFVKKLKGTRRYTGTLKHHAVMRSTPGRAFKSVTARGDIREGMNAGGKKQRTL
jgi:hypothetical protein